MTVYAKTHCAFITHANDADDVIYYPRNFDCNEGLGHNKKKVQQAYRSSAIGNRGTD